MALGNAGGEGDMSTATDQISVPGKWRECKCGCVHIWAQRLHVCDQIGNSHNYVWKYGVGLGKVCIMSILMIAIIIVYSSRPRLVHNQVWFLVLTILLSFIEAKGTNRF